MRGWFLWLYATTVVARRDKLIQVSLLGRSRPAKLTTQPHVVLHYRHQSVDQPSGHAGSSVPEAILRT